MRYSCVDQNPVVTKITFISVSTNVSLASAAIAFFYNELQRQYFFCRLFLFIKKLFKDNYFFLLNAEFPPTFKLTGVLARI